MYWLFVILLILVIIVAISQKFITGGWQDRKKCIQELNARGIYNRSDFVKWSLKNHPDKVPPDQVKVATALYQDIGECVNKGADYFGVPPRATPQPPRATVPPTEQPKTDAKNLKWEASVENVRKQMIQLGVTSSMLKSSEVLARWANFKNSSMFESGNLTKLMNCICGELKNNTPAAPGRFWGNDMSDVGVLWTKTIADALRSTDVRLQQNKQIIKDIISRHIVNCWNSTAKETIYVVKGDSRIFDFEYDRNEERVTQESYGML